MLARFRLAMFSISRTIAAPDRLVMVIVGNGGGF
jgi:hypothetical protein